jgi:hypothetical protein
MHWQVYVLMQTDKRSGSTNIIGVYETLVDAARTKTRLEESDLWWCLDYSIEAHEIVEGTSLK